MKIIICLLVTWLTIPLAHSRLLRILHTNDLHGQLLGTNIAPYLGGYAELKSMMDSITSSSEIQGIPVLRLDAGDFSEGALAYKARDGVSVFELMSMMGYDAITLGNHDYLMGAHKLNDILGEVHIPLIASNLKIKNQFNNIRNSIQPFRLIQKGDMSIAVIGGTNGDIFYKWVLKDDIQFKDSNRSINHAVRKIDLKSNLNIALTHMGLHGDKTLAKNSSQIDLIIGGHNHIQLNEPIFVKNKKGNEVPIFQMGDFGKFLGEILIEIDDDKEHGEKVKFISYKVHPVSHSSLKDPEILNKVNEILFELDQEYGSNYLHESLGRTTIPMENLKDQPTFWTTYFTNAIKESANAELAINNNSFFGPSQSAGEITREKIMNFFPHFFDLSQTYGWSIYRAQVSGELLKKLVDLSFEVGYPFLVSGMTFEIKTNSHGKKHAVNFLINGQPIRHFRLYSLALPQGYYEGLINSSPVLAKMLLKDAIDTKISIWKAVEEKVLRDKFVK